MSLLPPVARACLVGGVLLAAAGCSDTSGPVGPAQPPDNAALGPATAQQPADDPVGLVRGVRGFGGFFLDQEGRPTVYLTDPAEADAAANALAPFFAARGIDRSRLQVRRADFDYARLEGWFDVVSPEALALPGAVFADLDEASNRIRVGLARGAGPAELHRALAALHVPAEAVVVQETAPIRQLATLQERVRPVQGGLMIDFILGLCSLGFNALRSNQLSFITASHCTWAQGGVEGTIWYQHTWLDFSGSDNTIGSEVDDPVYFAGRKGRRGSGNGCPANRVCRRSDSSRGAYSIAAGDVGLGKVARTSGENNGLTDIVGSFQITAEHPSESFAIGSTVHKVGMTTGWTSAAVTATCVNVNIDGTSITQLCQTLAGLEGAGHPVIVGPGDSGSPIFIKTGDNTVTLAGILWGGTPEGGLLAFSPLKNVQQELGDLVVVAP
ncbi:MAG TPA: hypothetical protein VHJ69_06100 [Gemmatimonadales bacterium]|nr:hypothetical protein [Gemmatimonadales bacterium]